MNREQPLKVRFAPVLFPERYDLPPRPTGASPTIQDAHRQTQFLLAEDLSLFQKAMNLQLRVAGQSRRVQTQEAGAMLGLWSRTFSYLADICWLFRHGAYLSCFPVVRSACDAIVAQRCLHIEGFQEFHQWLAKAISQDKKRGALAIDLGRFRAGSLLAEDPQLGKIYRLATELTMPHFGSTLLQTGPESNLQRLALAFASNSFHLGWAEIIAGWLLVLARDQLETSIVSNLFVVSDDVAREKEGLSREVAVVLANPGRCQVEEVEGRFLFHNFRRTPGGAPKRVLL